ncbi:MAG TPA: type IV secretion system protein TraC [Methanothrix sp.]|nr:type IV secretion system protein TraC [Methanothrix sp.]HOK07772.1 type IV secretion system protein TraC [Syntrophales bacterium]HOL44477.1 type IV secretion system protein TraC [Methanothrix sp.]
MESLKAAKLLLKRYSLSELLPYLAYDKDSKAYILDHGVGLVYACHPLPFPDHGAVSSLRGLFESSFPPGTSIQFMLYSSKNIDHYLDSYVLYRANVHGDSVYTDIARKRADFLKEGTRRSLFKGADIRVKNYQILVSVLVPCAHTPKAIEETILNIIPPIRETTYQALNTAGLGPSYVSPEEFIRTMCELLNPGHDQNVALHYDPAVPIKDQLIYGDNEIRVEQSHLVIDGYYVRSFTVKQYPEQWNYANIINYIGDMFQNVKQIGVPLVINMNCEYPDVISARREIQNKSMIVTYQAVGQLASWIPKLALRKQHFDRYNDDLEHGATPFYSYMNMFTYSESETEMNAVSSILQTIYRGFGFILQEDSYIQLPVILQSLPLCYQKGAQRDLRRRRTLTTLTTAELCPLQADWTGTGRHVVPLISRRGQLQFIDIFSNKRGGYSGIVCASTGAGKSFFVNDMIIGYLGIGAKIWVIDVGRSYEKLCSFLGGDFLVFDTQSPTCINPFSSVYDINEEMPMLKTIIAQMASNTPLDDLSMSYLEEAIKECFARRGQDTTVTDIANYLTSQSDPRQNDLGKRLYPYTRQGSYAAFFEGRSSFAPDAQLVVLELEELKSKKDLQEVVLLSLIYTIQQEMMKRGQNKLVIIDEAWDLLTGGNTSQFMETGYRRFRKYSGGCITITQSVNDFYKIPAGIAIVENADYMFLLRQRAESIEALKKSQKVVLSEGLYELLKSVHTDTGNYSEIFLYTPDGIGIGRLVVDRFTQLLYTSKADEYLAIKQLTDRGMSVAEAIEEIMHQENEAAAGKGNNKR